ncbi:MFS transporter [Chloroflexota bacterium]
MGLWGAGYQVYGISALFKPIASELGFSRAQMSVPSSISRLEGGLESPLAGWITDRFGPRWIIIAGIFIIGLSLILMNYVESLWAVYIVWGVVLGTGFNIASSVPIDTAIANWFVKKRGLALSIKKVFDGLSGVIVLPLIAWLITTQGWRMTCVIGGLVMWLINLPLVWFFVKQRRPEYYGLLPDGATVEEEMAETNQMVDKGVKYAAEVEEVEFTLRQAMRTSAYWLLIITQAAHGLAGPALNIHAIPFLTDIGMDQVKAAGMMAVMVGASIPSRLIGGYLADRVNKNRLRILLGGTYLLQGIGFAVFLLNQTVPMIYVWFIFYGIGMGGGFVLASMLRARYFGRKAFGSIQGSSSAFMTPVGVIAPVYTGWIFDTTGNYISAFMVVAGLLILSGIITSFIISPKPPAKITGVREIV